MKIKPIDRPPTFGVYKGTKITHYGTRSNGVINGYKLDIYTAKTQQVPDQKGHYKLLGNELYKDDNGIPCLYDKLASGLYYSTVGNQFGYKLK